MDQEGGHLFDPSVFTQKLTCCFWEAHKVDFEGKYYLPLALSNKWYIIPDIINYNQY